MWGEVSLQRDPRAAAYADGLAPVFISRYLELARAGRCDAIPHPIRHGFLSYMEPLDAFYERRAAEEPDPSAWVWTQLYRARLRGETLPVPGGHRAVSIASASAAGGVFQHVLANFGRQALRR
jgi:hypothetical protein